MHPYLVAAKSFCTWLVRNKRTAENRLVSLVKLNPDADRRRNRRALSQAEFKKFIDAARGGTEAFGFSGVDRAMLYLCAAYTGFRASELASLTSRSFDFDSSPATITVKAAYSKRRRLDKLPLAAGFAETIRDWIANRQEVGREDGNVLPMHLSRSSEPLWAGEWAERKEGAKMVRHDLAAAGLPYADEDDRTFDFIHCAGSS